MSASAIDCCSCKRPQSSRHHCWQPVDPVGLAFWGGRLEQGASRIAVAQEIARQPEYQTLQIQSMYAAYLHRPAEPEGLNTWLAFLATGGNLTEVRLGILGSPEYDRDRGHGTPDGLNGRQLRDLAPLELRQRGEREIDLSAKEFAVLEVFMRRPGEVLSRFQLLEHAWDFAYENRSNIVDVYIRHLRRKIDEPFGRHSIETVRGAGYRLRADGGA